MTTRLFLIRHGEVAPEWRGRVYGCLDVQLSSRGREQARTAARRLSATEFAQVVHSGLSRSRYGAERVHAQRPQAHVEADSELREIERGGWAGASFEALERETGGAWSRWRAEPGASRPPDGESLEDLARRVIPRLDHWAQRGAGQPVALVLHLWVIRVAVCAALRLPLDDATRLALGTGDQVVLDWPRRRAGGGWRNAWTMGESPLTPRPTLVGFATDAPPDAGRHWFRGPT